MIALANGCTVSPLSVYPSNWKTSKAPMSKDWYINYRFYAPTDLNPKRFKQVVIKGMNKFKTLADRQQATRILLSQEEDMLFNQGYNPITKTRTPLLDQDSDIHPTLPLAVALGIAVGKLKCDPSTVQDVKYALGYVLKAIAASPLRNLQIGQISRRHIIYILEGCSKIKERWSPAMFNKYRTYLIMLFKVLVKYEALEVNPVVSIEKEKIVKTIRGVVTPDQRQAIVTLLKDKYYTFYRFLQIFFHSGARIKEMLRLQVKDVDLKNQQYKVVVRKGRQTEVMKTIKDIALPYWAEVLRGASPYDYVFSRNLSPGSKPIRREQIVRRWKNHVKVKLNITADFYSLKHLNTTEVVNALNETDAARMNSHQSTAMVVNIYDVDQASRQHKRLKGVANEF